MSTPLAHSLLLTFSPEKLETENLIRAIQEHLFCGDLSYLYCIHDGVRAIYDTRLQDLRKSGLHLLGCAYGAEMRNLPINEYAVFGGLGMLADMLQHSDTFSSFPHTPLPPKNAKGILVRPKSDSPSQDTLFEIYRVAAGLSSHSGLQVSIQIPRPIGEELLHNPDFLHFKEICNEHSVLILLDRADYPGHIPLEF